MNKTTTTTKQFFILCLFFIFNLNVFAQNNVSSIKGKVIDENEEPIPYASVAVYNSENHQFCLVVDDSELSGSYFRDSDKKHKSRKSLSCE